MRHKTAEVDEKGAYLASREDAVPPPKNAQVPLDQVVHPFDDETIRHIKKWFKYASI